MIFSKPYVTNFLRFRNIVAEFKLVTIALILSFRELIFPLKDCKFPLSLCERYFKVFRVKGKQDISCFYRIADFDLDILYNQIGVFGIHRSCIFRCGGEGTRYIDRVLQIFFLDHGELYLFRLLPSATESEDRSCIYSAADCARCKGGSNQPCKKFLFCNRS